jgi:sec-independent protein translocase protein TatC
MSDLPFWNHVEELRKTLIRSGLAILGGTCVALYFHKKILRFLLAPLASEPLYFLSPLEGFATSTKVSLWMGLILSSPFWLYFLLRFFLPALRSREKRLLLPFLALSPLFAGGGALFAYKVTLPLVLRFFRHFNAGVAENLWSVKETLNLSLGLILSHALLFELYLLMLFLIRLGLLPYSLLRRGRKGGIVAIFVLAAILTPPDVLSQLLLAFPLLLLFESTLLYAKVRNK